MNWKIRFSKVSFWLAIVPAVLMVIQSVAAVFGFNLDFTALNEQLAAVINAVFGVLILLGIVADPTTPGIGDSERAKQYVKPGVIGKHEK